MNFCKEVIFVCFIDEFFFFMCLGFNCLILIIINLVENDILIEIKVFVCIYVMNEFDIKNERKWFKLKRVLESYFKDKLYLLVFM